MNAFSTPQEPFGNFFDRSPVDMPPPWVRSILQQCAAHIRMENMKRGNLMSVRCITDGLDNFAEGETAAGCEAMRNADAERERGE